MAELFVARLSGAAGFSKTVVIKRILPHVAHDLHFTRMFLDEAITCAQINHPNVCQVFELCEAQNSLFLVLEHLEGATVGDLIRRCVVSNQQVNLRLAAGIVVQACDGLHAAHELRDDQGASMGLVHRDVSPGNLFVTVDGIVKVLDFGIAKAAWMSRKTRTGTLLGKCEYMSPEQARGGIPLDRRSDIFSLGITAWELVCGKRLFRKQNDYESLKAVLRAPIVRPMDMRVGVPEALDQAIMKALERDPDDRYDNAYQFRQAISDALSDIGGPTPMCDIAPLIRSSFAEELAAQRQVLREAKRLRQHKTPTPALRSLPALSEGLAANTGVVTGAHERLPSLETGSDEEVSKELTFRVVPRGATSNEVDLSTPPLADDLRDAADTLVERARRSATPLAQPGDARIELLTSAPLVGMSRPEDKASPSPVPVAPAQSAQASVAVTHATAPGLAIAKLDEPARTLHELPVQAPRALVASDIESGSSAAIAPARLSWILLLAMAALCGALVTSATLLWLNKGTSKSAALATPQEPAPRALPSADENAMERAKLMAANRSQAVVTQLPGRGASEETPEAESPPAEMGRFTIHSSMPAQVYLYPDKQLIGTTPIEDFVVPPGEYKLKLMIGPDKGQRKYLQLKVEAGKTSVRSYQGWRE